jgi:hypothetical protein
MARQLSEVIAEVRETFLLALELSISVAAFEEADRGHRSLIYDFKNPDTLRVLERIAQSAAVMPRRNPQGQLRRRRLANHRQPPYVR